MAHFIIYRLFIYIHKNTFMHIQLVETDVLTKCVIFLFFDTSFYYDAFLNHVLAHLSFYVRNCHYCTFDVITHWEFFI